MAQRHVRIAWCLVLGLLAAPSARAIDREIPFEQMAHRIWTSIDGAPSEIDTIAQTHDGLLWLGTANGLFRFDGMRFQRYEPAAPATLPTEIISALYVTADGSLWIGYRGRGIARLMPDGTLRQYDAPASIEDRLTVRHFLQASDGRLWAASRLGLLWLDGEQWRVVGEEHGYPPGDVYSISEMADGSVWTAGANGVFRLDRRASQFRAIGLKVALGGTLLAAPAGMYLAGGGSGLRRLAPTLDAELTDPIQIPGGTMLLDRDRMLWVDLGAELRRMPIDASDLATDRMDRLLEFDTRSIFEDREGNVWVGTHDALHQFRATPVRAIGTLNGGLAPADDGGVWLAAYGSGLYRLDGDEGHPTPVPGVVDDQLTHVLRDADGDLWLGGVEPTHLWHVQRTGAVERVAAPALIQNTFVNALAQDAAGRIWLGLSGGAAWMHCRDQGRWLARCGIDALPPQYSRSMLGDAAGRMWIGYDDGRLAMIQDDALRIFDTADGLAVGSIMRLHVHRRRLLVFGESGMAIQRGDGFVTVFAEDGGGLRGISGATQQTDGTLWLNGSDGILRVEPVDLANAAESPLHELRVRRFDAFDGIEGRAIQFAPWPAAATSSDGMIWLATSAKLYRVDPASYRPNAQLPDVRIDAVRIEGTERLSARDGLRLPAGTRRIEFDYTAGSLTVPERVRFRHRLSGVDDDWMDAGGRRSASYSNLVPGDYRFEVIAANEDGLWSERPEALSFRIEPAFHQTRWFTALCGVSALLLAWSLYRLRLHQMSARLRLQIGERLAERERIARELHDTLLQSVQALIWRVDAAVRRLPADAPGRVDLGRAVVEAGRVLAEGRDRVQALRDDAGHEPLEVRLERLAQRLLVDAALQWSLAVDGAPRALQPLPQDEVLQIAREALVNVVRHAGARRVALIVRYDARAFELAVRDDGRGPPLDPPGGEAGHWGLLGMRERARNIGATLDVVRAEPGTEVRLRAPASVYA